MADELVIDSRDGPRLAARRSGSGTPLVLVHGGVVDKDASAFVEPLLAERHQVWSYDRRGDGASGDATDHATEREVEDDLVAVVAATGTPVHLTGHSDGARVCLEAAAQLPELRSVVLYEPGGVTPQQQVPADTLGLSRVTVNRAPGALERDGLVQVAREQVAVLLPELLATQAAATR